MLCLTLNEGEMIVINTPSGEILIKVTEIRTHSRHVRVAIGAPDQMTIGRASEWPRAGERAAAVRAAAVGRTEPKEVVMARPETSSLCRR